MVHKFGGSLMGLTAQQFADYLCTNEGTEYLVEGTTFSFSLHDPREDEFPYSIRFSSGQWSATTIRAAGARRIARFLAVFNDGPTLDWRDYRNRDGQGSSATTAKYLVHLMRKACEPTG